ncbi:MAG: hypothetical protein GOMPHAMPRED_004465 [Gomphillus americanus]|uniref:Uncharacterized protein n=1 Tax=Gomphillus americanus TaxID=1940652 RepID=A0A8H3ITW4_9LECA|nr:MAG: hypothetical protein GOMPHAMPRED_004465 [Gomphillus americanus]
MDKEELLPLCESNDDLEGKPPQNPVPRRWEGHKSIRLFPWPLILIHAAFILAYTVAFFVLVSAETPMSSLVYSPAREALRYMPKTVSVLYNDTTNLFLQESGEGVEEAWYQLLQNLNIRMTENEMLALGRESVRLSDGSGDSLVSLGMAIPHIKIDWSIDQYGRRLPSTALPGKRRTQHEMGKH